MTDLSASQEEVDRVRELSMPLTHEIVTGLIAGCLRAIGEQGGNVRVQLEASLLLSVICDAAQARLDCIRAHGFTGPGAVSN